MPHIMTARLEHLRRLTDPRGLLQAAIADCPDRSRGYVTVQNADALRLCAQASDTVDAPLLKGLARIYYAYLLRMRMPDGRVHHSCSAAGRFRDDGNDAVVQSRLARALAAVIVSELPIQIRLGAAGWWRQLLPLATVDLTPVAAGNWLVAIAQLRSADPGRDLACADKLAAYLTDDCYYPTRCGDWEWFESHWTSGAAVIPKALWQASELLERRQFASVARVTTDFLVAQLFEGDQHTPVGSIGAWQHSTPRPIHDQLPDEVCSMVEMLQTAAHISGSDHYAGYAATAARWFTGSNTAGRSLVCVETGGCLNALQAGGLARDQGGAAVLAWLLTVSAMTGSRVSTAAAAPAVPVY